jgi:hypothetical protein
MNIKRAVLVVVILIVAWMVYKYTAPMVGA